RCALSTSGVFFFSSRRRHTRFSRDWSSDVCSSDLVRGTFAASLVLGIVDTGGKYLFPAAGGFLIYALTMGLLLWRPQGLMGRARSEERRVGEGGVPGSGSGGGEGEFE